MHKSKFTEVLESLVGDPFCLFACAVLENHFKFIAAKRATVSRARIDLANSLLT